MIRTDKLESCGALRKVLHTFLDLFFPRLGNISEQINAYVTLVVISTIDAVMALKYVLTISPLFRNDNSAQNLDTV
jgi:hypothetical protein